MSAQAQMRALLDQLMGTARDGESERPTRRGSGVGVRRGRRAA
ncbi:LUC7L isoform 2 [Pan troglodytes]|uniref:LUC7 like n=2 Tax=Homininae TaxID=207598 RepID=F8WBC1_HUMAN|nr:LUC7L isoform 2 [Pan troglodytes]